MRWNDENKYVKKIERQLVESSYEQSEYFPYFDENALEGRLMLNSFFKNFDKKYVIKISTEGKNTVPMSDVCWTIWYCDGSKEWGSVKDVAFGFDPRNAISVLENHAKIAYEEKTKK